MTDEPIYTFAWPDRIDERVADYERRIAALERKITLLLMSLQDVSRLLLSMAEAIERDEGDQTT